MMDNSTSGKTAKISDIICKGDGPNILVSMCAGLKYKMFCPFRGPSNLMIFKALLRPCHSVHVHTSSSPRHTTPWVKSLVPFGFEARFPTNELLPLSSLNK
ncbi:hypothetical protein EVAR_103476_1 [Eumeta japonica]|uniref:Uncharacterized protein n=1 Tax=Eumeta variegata TaxID=151549 RepID=A0A4C1YYL9_EUMVA|nr:hypothetical protein EVAR_103476_1 [Eumeta japonica]